MLFQVASISCGSRKMARYQFEGKVLPLGEARRVETEEGKRQQGQMQKGEERHGISGQPPPHASCSLSRRSNPHTSRITSTIRSMETAEPNGQSRALVN